MAKDSSTSAAGSAAQFESQIRAKARPVLSREERRMAAAEKVVLEAQLAAARCREAAEAQMARAEAFDAQAAELQQRA